MKQVKLTPIQKQKLISALQREAGLREQLATAQAIYRDAARAKTDTLEMIADAHGVDLKDYNENLQVKEDLLILTEKQAETRSKQIRRQLKKTK